MLRAVAAVSAAAVPAFRDLCKAMSLHLLCGGAKPRQATSKLSGAGERALAAGETTPALARAPAQRRLAGARARAGGFLAPAAFAVDPPPPGAVMQVNDSKIGTHRRIGHMYVLRAATDELSA